MAAPAPTPHPTRAASSSPHVPLTPLEGGCACSYFRYTLHATPIVVNICHCHTCQRETGGAFAVNYLTETSSLTITPASRAAEVIDVKVPSASGRGYTVARCPVCFTAIYARYFGPLLLSVRATTLDEVAKGKLWGAVERGEVQLVHIFVESKVPWVELPAGAVGYERFYDFDRVLLRAEGRERWRRIVEGTEELRRLKLELE